MWRPRWSGRYDLPVPRPHPQSVAARQRRASRPIFLLGVESARAVTLAAPLVGSEEEDAMTAIASACKATHDQAGDVFSPIDVCQAHHVTAEFSARYDLAVHRIKALLNCAHISAAH